MLHVIINNTRYDLADDSDPETLTEARIRAAQAAMLAANVLSAPILTVDDETGEAEETGDTLPDEIDDKAWALAAALDCSPIGCSYDGRGHGPDVWSAESEPGEYYVLDSSEREETALACLGSYLEDCILSQIPESLQTYFDGDAWKQDALDTDGYGHTISTYDDEEHEVCVEGCMYYVYRIN